MQTQELVTIIPWTFIAQICNLFIQVFLIRRFLFKPVNAMLDKRKAAADAQLADARRTREEAEAVKADYEKNMAMARDEAKAILGEAKKAAAIKKEAILAEAGTQAAQIRSRAQAEIIQEQKKAVNDVKREISRIAVDLAGKVIEREIREDDHRKLIDEFIRNAGEAS